MKRLALLLLLLCSAFVKPGVADIRAQTNYIEANGNNVPNADSIMARTFQYQQERNLHIGHIKSQVYTKFHINTDIHNVLLRIIPNTIHISKGKNHYFGESMALLEYSDIGVANRKVLAFHSTLRRLKELRDVYMTNVSVQVYSPYMISNKLLSPFNRVNRKYYSYNVDTTKAVPQNGMAWVAFTPRNQNSLLVKGCALIDVSTGKLDSVRFKAVYDNMLHCDVRFKLGKDGICALLAEKVDFDARYKFAGNRVDIAVESLVDHIETDERHYADSLSRVKGSDKYNITRLDLLSPESGSIVRSRDFFANTRPVPLTSEEDSLLQMREKPVKADTTKDNTKSIVELSADAFEDVFLDRHNLKLFNNRAQISIPPILSLSMLQWSGSRGFSIQKRFKFSLQTESGVSVNMRPKVGYNFKQKILYWEVPLNMRLFPKQNGGFALSVGNGNKIYSSLQAKEVREQLKQFSNYDSLLSVFNKYNFNYYKDLFARSLFYISPKCGMDLELGVVFHQRKPTNWNKEAELGGMRKYYKSFAPHVEMTYTPGMYYYESRRGKVPLHSHCPTFRGSYERGVNWLDCKNRYEKMEFDCSHRIDIGKLSSLYLRGGCGFFTNRKDMYFVDYDNFLFHDMPAGWDDDMTGEFHLLDRRFYNESNYYVLLGSSYDTPMLLLGKLPLVSRVITRERVYFNAVCLHALNPYVECGYGVATSMFDGALFVGAGNGTGFEFGAKISLRFFDKW